MSAASILSKRLRPIYERAVERLARLERKTPVNAASQHRPTQAAKTPPPLSILHVDLTHNFGGTERYCADLMRYQLEAGHRVSLVAWQPRHGQKDAVQDHVPPGAHVYLVRRNFARFAIARAIREQHADIINAHLGDSARAVKLVKPRPPAVLTLHLRYRADQTKGLEGLIYIADWQKKEIAKFPGLSTTAYNWPPAVVPAEPDRVAALRRQIGAKPDTVVAGYIGRLVRVKDVDLLIEAYRAAATPNSMLAIVGDGPERAKLEALARGEPRIRFLGHQTEIDAWHRAFDLFVLASHWEGLPLTPLEAMRCGTPILATACAGTEEVLRDTSATLVPPGDVETLSAALKHLLTRAEEGALPRTGYDLARFDARRSVAHIEDFYRQVIAARVARKI